MMIDVSSRNMKTSVLGTEISMPIGIAPTAMQKMAHPEGECAAAKAAEKAGTLFIMSTISTSSIEEVAQAAPKALKWFQLYIYKDREVLFIIRFFWHFYRIKNRFRSRFVSAIFERKIESAAYLLKIL